MRLDGLPYFPQWMNHGVIVMVRFDLTFAKVMKSDENAKKVGKNKRIYFALSSLNRNFDLRSKIGYASEKSKNVWFFVRLALPLQPFCQKYQFATMNAILYMRPTL